MIPSKCGLPPGADILALCHTFNELPENQNPNKTPVKVPTNFPSVTSLTSTGLLMRLFRCQPGEASLLPDSSLPGNTLPFQPHVLCGCVDVCTPPTQTHTHTLVLCTRKHSQRRCHSRGCPLPSLTSPPRKQMSR